MEYAAGPPRVYDLAITEYLIYNKISEFRWFHFGKPERCDLLLSEVARHLVVLRGRYQLCLKYPIPKKMDYLMEVNNLYILYLYRPMVAARAGVSMYVEVTCA